MANDLNYVRFLTATYATAHRVHDALDLSYRRRAAIFSAFYFHFLLHALRLPT